jgi:Predicted integral membrane protein
MKRSSAELKSLARETLKGKYGTFIGTVLIYGLIVFGASIVVALATIGMRNYTYLIVQLCLQLILAFVWMIFSVGFVQQAMKACRGEEIAVKDLFYGFTHNPDRYIIVSLLMVLIALIFMIPFIALFVIGGLLGGGAAGIMMIAGVLFYIVGIVFLIIITLGLSLCYYLILDNPGMTAMESLKTSWQLMKGNKGRLFYLSLSFIGISLLGAISVVGMLWVTPYINVTTAYFYFDVIGKLDAPSAPVAEVASTPATPIVPVAPPVNPVATMVPVEEAPVEPVEATAPVEPVETPVVETPVVEELKEEVVNVDKQAHSDAPYVDDPVVHNTKPQD